MRRSFWGCVRLLYRTPVAGATGAWVDVGRRSTANLDAIAELPDGATILARQSCPMGGGQAQRQTHPRGVAHKAIAGEQSAPISDLSVPVERAVPGWPGS
jgi:hypothetical protein